MYNILLLFILLSTTYSLTQEKTTTIKPSCECIACLMKNIVGVCITMRFSLWMELITTQHLYRRQ